MILPKVEIKKILYTTDLSDTARYAFSYAASLANLCGASVTVLHVLYEVPSFLDTSVIGYIGEDRWNEIKQHHFDEARESLIGKRRDNVAIKEVLAQFCDDAKAECMDGNFVTDEIVVVRGNPVEEIIKQSQERNCDLIVMGTHGHKSLVDAMMGSTARRVLRRSKIPVLVVRLPEEC